MTKSLIALAILREMIDKKDPKWIIESTDADESISSAFDALVFAINYLQEIQVLAGAHEVGIPIAIPQALESDQWATGYIRSVLEKASDGEENSGADMVDYPHGLATLALLLHMVALNGIVVEISNQTNDSPEEIVELIAQGLMSS